MQIRTKIVATVGPACKDETVLEKMTLAGVDVFRINFSHGDEDTRLAALEAIRRIEKRLDRPLAVMADLCGPKIRVGTIVGGSVLLGEGAQLAVRREPIEGTAGAISTTLAELVDLVQVGQNLLLDEGNIVLKVVQTNPPEQFICEIVAGGMLASGRGVHVPQTQLELAALTEKDRRDVAWMGEREFDFAALSFVQRPEDVTELRRLLPAEMKIVAKIETAQALGQIDQIVAAADAIMVARGDLGVEMPLPQVPLTQKRLGRLCRQAGKACIVATQMLESMTHEPLPTRAEVADIANAVLDGADAVMLSGETAVGKHPAAAVAMMNEIASAAEEYEVAHPTAVQVGCAASRTTAALAAAVGAVVEAEDISAAAVFTATGTTAAVLAQQRLALPILGMSPSLPVVRQMQLLFGVRPVVESAPEHTRDVLAAAERHLTAMGLVKPGERIVVLSGRPIGSAGATNTLVVHTVA